MLGWRLDADVSGDEYSATTRRRPDLAGHSVRTRSEVVPGLIAKVHGSEVPLADLGEALGDIAADYRVIGGHMVTMLAARWQQGAGLCFRVQATESQARRCSTVAPTVS